MQSSQRLGEHYNRYDYLNFNESNAHKYFNNQYDHVFSPEYNQKLSVIQEPDIVYDKIEHYLAISSFDRDIDNYPKSNSYSITLPKEFRNVIRIQLIESIVPNRNNISHQPYLLLNIKELEGKIPIDSMNPAISKSFAIIQLTNGSGKFVQIDRKVHENIVFNALQPINLSKMTITLTDYAGVPFEFGNDTGGSFNPEYQNTLIFKIVTLEKSRKSLEYRADF